MRVRIRACDNVRPGTVIGLLSSVWVVFVSAPLFAVPSGATIRPMGLAAVAIGSALLGLVLAAAVMAGDRNMSWRQKVVGWCLALFPLFFVMVGWQVIAAVRGFRLAD